VNKKEAKKTLLNLDRAGETNCGPDYQKFFGYFFSKKHALGLDPWVTAFLLVTQRFARGEDALDPRQRTLLPDQPHEGGAFQG
jgi:hypothetical protein